MHVDIRWQGEMSTWSCLLSKHAPVTTTSCDLNPTALSATDSTAAGTTILNYRNVLSIIRSGHDWQYLSQAVTTSTSSDQQTATALRFSCSAKLDRRSVCCNVVVVWSNCAAWIRYHLTVFAAVLAPSMLQDQYHFFGLQSISETWLLHHATAKKPTCRGPGRSQCCCR
jgi:hypothetical protein